MKKCFSLCFAVALLLGASPLVRAQSTPRNVQTLTLSDSSIATSATEVSTSEAFTIKADSGFAILVSFQLSGADTANVTFSFAVSIDGTTWSTTTPYTYTVAATGTTPVIGFCNFPPHVAGNGANNIRYARLASITNASSTRTVAVNYVKVTRNN
jgi:hypothetical protein